MNEEQLKEYIKNFTKEQFLNSDITQKKCPQNFDGLINASCHDSCTYCWELAIKNNNLKFRENKTEIKDSEDQIESLQIENLVLKNILKTIIELNTQTTKQLAMLKSILKN